MDTESGRIYPPEEMAKRIKAQGLREAFDDHQAEFERRLAEGRIVEVSEKVAEQQLAGQQAMNRAARRKAAKAARKKNR